MSRCVSALLLWLASFESKLALALQGSSNMSFVRRDGHKRGITDIIHDDQNVVMQGLQLGYMKTVEGLEEAVQESKEAVGAGATDTSWHGQSSFVLADAAKRHITPGFVVDIGAHDGIWQSNSYYFLQLGYPALLVEATPATYAKLVANVDKYKKTATANAIVSLSDGAPMRLSRMGWFDGTENTFGRCLDKTKGPCTKGVTLPTLLAENNVPKRSFLLSLDIEFDERTYVRMLESLKPSNYTFDYIVVESCCNNELMASLGYKFLQKMGYDSVYRHMRV
jgi:FkbM family methyltransferase